MYTCTHPRLSKVPVIEISQRNIITNVKNLFTYKEKKLAQHASVDICLILVKVYFFLLIRIGIPSCGTKPGMRIKHLFYGSEFCSAGQKSPDPDPHSWFIISNFIPTYLKYEYIIFFISIKGWIRIRIFFQPDPHFFTEPDPDPWKKVVSSSLY